jgi:hypothetical protein
VTARPRLSVCIPAYNRAAFLPALLDSIVQQDYPSFEIVICEDRSPEREQIAEIVRRYASRRPGLLRYFENEKNLGYDGNLRRVIEGAHGDYCVMMGNDDLMCPGALDCIGSAVSRHDNVGVVVRSYASFDERPDEIDQRFVYFPEERFFPPGAESIATCYRRSVVISGMVLHRAASLRWATDRYDGTTLYQLFLVASILADMNAVFLPQILVLYRNGTPPDFGSSEAERGKFVPGQQTPESSEHFMRGMLAIAADVERTRGIAIYDRIRNDIDNYSYPILSIQAHRPAGVFTRYAWHLVGLGLGRGAMFYIYFTALLFLGPNRVDRLIAAIKRRIGHTPSIGGFYRGRSR